MNTYSYDDIAIGQSASFGTSLTHESILQFSALTGDQNPLHLNKEFASTTAFGKPVVFGLLVSSFLSTLAGMHLPGKYSLILSTQTFFRKPCFEGDRLQIEGKVKHKVDVGKILVLSVLIKNQHEDIVMDGEMKVQVLK